MVRVWFSAWFSTIYRMIDLLKNNEDNMKFYIIGTNTNINAVYRGICDEWYEEILTVDGEEYVKWALEFCKEHNVNVFIPRKNMIDISKSKEKFEEIGVKVLVESNYHIMEILSDKMETSKYFLNNKICKVANFEIVDKAEDFEKKYNKIKQESYFEKICLKYVSGEGGMSFRIIEEEIEDMSILDKGYNYKINYDLLLEMIRKSNKFKPIMLMPYIEGTEISIDCLQTNEKLIAIPRYKSGVRKETIKFDEEKIEIVEKFNNVAKLECPFNIQFIYHNNELYILEVNTRMSGGLYMSCQTGCNILYIAIRKMLNLPIKLNKYPKELAVGYIEEGIVL